MITWEPTHDGYLECFVGNVYGFVGLTHDRGGWTARLECPRGQLTAPALFHTAREAKLWVEAQIDTLCEGTSLELGFRSPIRTSSSRPWQQTMLTGLRRLIETYQHWNALFFNPQSDGSLPLCYATVQHTTRRAQHQFAFSAR